LVKNRINTKKYSALVYKEDRLSYLRALAVNTLISDVIDVFVENENAILNGSFDVSLLDRSQYKAQIDDIISLSVKKVYRAPEVLEKEIAGYKIISDLLDVYCTALVRKKEDKASNYDRLMINTLPKFYRRTELPLYNILLNTCCYVASMSDGVAILLHKKINGLEI
jgi:dGTPase